MNPFSSSTKLEERIVLSATQKHIPLGGSFELLPLCNMNCRMCFLRLSPAEMQEQGRLRTADEWLSLAEQAQKAGLLFLLLTGGEPFLYPEFKKLYEGLCKLGLIITINSNGTLITKEYADLLAQHKPRRVNITLYGSSDKVYGDLCMNPKGFSQAMQSIQLLKERNIDVKLNGSLTKYNRDDLENIQRIAHELSIPLEVDSYMFPCSRKGSIPFEASSRLSSFEAAEGFVNIKRDELTTEEFSKLAKAMSNCYQNAKDLNLGFELPPYPLPCRAGRSAFWVNWKGNMTPCVFMETPAIDVFKEGFEASWEFIKQESSKIYLPKQCTTCGKRRFCTVCAASCITETGGTETAPSYMCDLTTETMRLMHELHMQSQIKPSD